jgi:acyl carrier protein
LNDYNRIKIRNLLDNLFLQVGVDPNQENLSEKLDSLYRIYIIEKIEIEFDLDLTEMLARHEYWLNKATIVAYIESKINNE